MEGDNIISASFGGKPLGGKTDSLRQPPPDQPGVVRTLGAHWSAARLGTMPDLSREPDHEYGNQYVVRAAAIVCRGRLNFTCVLPSMRQPPLPEYLASHVNDNQETDPCA